MISLALYALDRALRQRLERLFAEPADIEIIGAAETQAGLKRLIDRSRVDVVLGTSMLEDFQARAAFVLIPEDAGEEAMIEALYAGAHAVLSASSDDATIVAAVTAAAEGLALLPRPMLDALLRVERRASAAADGEPEIELTPREIEVLSAMADGASNKAIARRLDISFHTVKFHVASILTKLDADSRTEAVTQAARLGLVML